MRSKLKHINCFWRNSYGKKKTYSNLNKVGQYRPPHVDGQTLYKVFQCLNPDCTEIITVENDDIDEDYSIVCPKCGYEHYSGGEQHLFDFSMNVNDETGAAVSAQEGEFVVTHDEYIENAALYKYCLLCNTLKPIECFINTPVWGLDTINVPLSTRFPIMWVDLLSSQKSNISISRMCNITFRSVISESKETALPTPTSNNSVIMSYLNIFLKIFSLLLVNNG